MPQLPVDDAGHFIGSPPIPPSRVVAPLQLLPAAQRDRIADLVIADRPPPRTIHIGLGEMVSRAWVEWHWLRGIDPFARERIPPAVRQKVIDRDGHRCGLCGGDVEPRDIQIDHINPRSLGGSHDLDNLQVAHSSCNARKGNRV